MWLTPRRLFERDTDIIYLKNVVKTETQTRIPTKAHKYTEADTHKDTIYTYTQAHQAHPQRSPTLATALCVIHLPKARRRDPRSLSSCEDSELGPECINLGLAEEWAQPPPFLFGWRLINLSWPLAPLLAAVFAATAPRFIRFRCWSALFFPSQQSLPDGQIYHPGSLQNHIASSLPEGESGIWGHQAWLV